MIQANHQVRRLKVWFDALDQRRTVVLTTVIILLIVLVDAVTGSRLRFTMFYLLPVWIAAWKLGFGPSMLFAAAGALAGSFVNVRGTDPGTLAHLALWFWDLGARLIPMAIVAWLADTLQTTIQRERQLARSDALTGALNRRAVFEEATRALARGQRLGLTTGFLYLDLDGFKTVNDEHGHAAGDELLVRFVAATKARLRRGDLIGRVGGDEFVLLLVEATPRGAERAARRVCGELRALVRTWQPPVSFCAGLCLIQAGVTQDPAVAMAEADKMLYAAKRAESDADWFQVVHLPTLSPAPRVAPRLGRAADPLRPDAGVAALRGDDAV